MTAGSRSRSPAARLGRQQRGLRYGPPLLSPAGRVQAGLLLASCAIIVAVLGVLFAHQTAADRLDHAVDAPVITWLGGHHGLALWLAAPGSQLPAAGLSGLLVVACLLAGRLNGAVLAAAAVPATVALTDGLCKPLVHRTYLGALSYPSGHTATIFALAATVAVLLHPRPLQPGRGRLGPGCCGSRSRPPWVCWDAWSRWASSRCAGTTSPTPWRVPQ